MVVVVGRSDQERREIAKKQTLIEVTEKILGESNRRDISSSVGFSLCDNRIFVNHAFNRVTVSKPDLYDTALKLASAYEEATKEGFTLKKDYDE